MADFMFDAQSELEQVDGLMTKLISDKEEWKSFVINPLGSFQKHLDTRYFDNTYEPIPANHFSNKILHALLYTPGLWQAVNESMQMTAYEVGSRGRYIERRREGFSRREIAHTFEYDKDVVSVLFGNGRFKEGVGLAIRDLNALKLLPNELNDYEIDNFVDEFVSAGYYANNISDLPSLKTYDHGGPDHVIGAATAFVAVVAVAVVAAEIAVGATVGGAHPEDQELLRLPAGGPSIWQMIREARADPADPTAPTGPKPEPWTNPDDPDFPDIDPIGPIPRIERVVDRILEDSTAFDFSYDEKTSAQTLVEMSTLISDLYLAASVYRKQIEEEASSN